MREIRGEVGKKSPKKENENPSFVLRDRNPLFLLRYVLTKHNHIKGTMRMLSKIVNFNQLTLQISINAVKFVKSKN